MNSLSIAPAGTGSLTLAGQIATTLKNYVDGAEEAPNEIQSLLSNVTAFQKFLEEIMLFTSSLRNDDFDGQNSESSSLLFRADKLRQYQLEELRGKLAGLQWPPQEDEVQQTILALQRFVQLFQFSMMIHKCELLSGTPSATILQLDENWQEMENIMSIIQSISISVPPALQQKVSESTEIKALVSELDQLKIREVSDISLETRGVQRRLQDDEMQQIMPLISTLEPHKRHHDIRQNRLEDTGQWFLDESAFERWSDIESDDGNTGSILVCSGVPGAGKSVICSLVVDHLEQRLVFEERACVAYLYCDHLDGERQTPANMIGVLLKQVIVTLNKRGLLPLDTIADLREYLKKHWSVNFDRACQLLRQTVKQLRRFYVCIDALGECSEEHRGEFLEALASVAGECKQPGFIRIFLTTRPNVMLEELMSRHARLGFLEHVVLEAQPEDIRKYVSHKIEKDGNGDCMNDKLKNEILERIMETYDRM